ncbi:MAG TPA: carboxypeptidase regulatory-like domain-containing protein [Candidatus Angelobacter sp.]|nr:carboxypeptidase regulatory-like domain-containing protein [Candidatus Angelobacter sp.]
MSTRRLALFASLLIVFTPSLFAQETTGTILGTVMDSSGAVIPGATVIIRNMDRDAVIRTTTTGKEGTYVAPLLPIGRYSVRIEARGFNAFLKNNIELNIRDQYALNATLSPGGTTQVITVEAEAGQIDTQSATATGLINGTQIRELALSARNYEELVALAPGVSSAVSDNIFVGVETPGGGTNEIDFSVNGNRFSQNNWTVDGADNVDRGGNFSLLNYPSVDAIAEFKILRSLYGAESGRGAGGEIDLVTKSGTSKFHGGLYEFFRNDVLNANRYISNKSGVPRDPLRYNDFGWTLGGPVFIPGVYNESKNKTFFFYSEELRRIITFSPFTTTVPNQNERQGIFANPVCTGYDASGNCLGSTMVINPGQLNPASVAFMKDVFSKFPLPQDPVTDQLVLNGRNQFNYRQEIIRLDHTVNQKLSLMARWINDSIPTVNPAGLFGQSNLPGFATTNTNSPGKNILVRATFTPSSHLLNEGGYAWSYGAIKSNPIGLNTFTNSPDVAAAISLPFPVTLQRIPNLNFVNGNNGGLFGFGPYRDINRNHNVFDNLTWIHERHTLKFGFSLHHYQKDENDAGGQNPSNGLFTFFGTDPTGTPTFQQEWASFLLGNVSNFRQTKLDFAAKIRQHSYDFYGQDEYHILPRLTLTYGVRYTHYGQPFDALDRNSNFSPAAYNPAQAQQIDPTTGLIVPGTGTPLNGMIISGVNSPFGRAVASQSNFDLAPRVGLAWDPFGKGKTSIRTGFGIFYDSPAIGFVENNLFLNPPAVGSVSISNTVLNNPASVAADVNLNPQTIKGVKTDFHLPYTQQWSLDVEQELPFHFVLDAGYYGNVARHLFGIVDINQPAPGAYLAAGLPMPSSSNSTAIQQLDFVRPFKGYGPINVSSTVFSSNYNALQVSLQKHLKGGSLINVNYTWSHALTNATTDFATPQNNADIAADYGPAQFDRRHIFNANFVWVMPWLKSQTGFLGHTLGGWEISGIVTFNSGLFLTPTGVSSDPAGLGLLDPTTNIGAAANNGPRPDQVSDPNRGAPHTADQWFNTAAFVDLDPNNIRPGNAPRGSIRGPGIERWDLSLFKNVKLTESMGFQFRLEAFNVLNHTNFETIDTNLFSSTFGQVLATHNPRIMQLGLKFNF